MALWEPLDHRLDEILNGYEVPVLHAKEFQATKGTFSGWSKIKKRTLATELFDESKSRIFGLSVAVPRPEIVSWKQESGRLPNMSPIGVCFAAIMLKILTDGRTAERAKSNGIAFLVESGNNNNAEIEKYFHQMAKQPAFGGALRSISFIPKTCCRAIQLADFFAYYSRRYLRDHARFSGRLRLPMSPYLGIIEKRVPIWQWVGRGTPQLLDMNIKDVSDVSELLPSLKNAKPA